MHFRICCATILVNQLSARVDSQMNFSVVVHELMQNLPRGPTIFFWGGGGFATRGVAMRLLGGSGACFPKKLFEWCNLVSFGAYFHKFFTFKKSKNIIFIRK